MQNRGSWLLRHRGRGASLIEVLIAMILIAIVISGLIAIFTQSLSVQNEAEDIVKAVNMAREKMEELKALGYDNIPVGEQSEELEDGMYTIQTVVTENVQIPGSSSPAPFKKIEITVYRNKPTQVLISRHVTYIYEEGV